MALNYSFPGPTNKADATALRKDIAGLIVRDTSGIPRGGIFPRHGNTLVTARSDWKLDVAAFEGVSVRGGGPLFMANDGTAQTPPLPGAPVANSQISVVYFKQNESASPYSDTNDLPEFGIVTGAAAPIPVKPALTIAGAEELCTVTIPSTATAGNSAGVVITPTHRFTTTAGGVLLFRTVTEMEVFTTAARGQACYVWATDAEYVCGSAGWRRTTVASGIASFTTDASGLGYITHGLGAAPSSVQVTPGMVNDTVNPLWMLSVGALTSTQIQVVSFRNDSRARLATTPVVVHWTARP